MNERILMIDDDADLGRVTADYLRSRSYQVRTVESVEDAFDVLSTSAFDLIILDINLPDGDGLTLCKELRRVSSVPVIFASARTSESDRIVGFDSGGDDYLPKPFSLRELDSRIAALLRRAYGSDRTDETIVAGDLELSPSSRTARWRGEELKLSPKEFDLLAHLARNPGVIHSKESLLREVWGMYTDVEPSTVAVHIRWLREKIEDDPSDPHLITTVWGRGYRFAHEA